jgi:hypothetical protein
MMPASKMRTRGKGSAKTAAEAVAATASTAPKVPLKPELSNPPKIFILPKDASPDARIVTLANPRTTLDTRYFCCPEKGLYEFTKIAEPRTTPRSWLLAPSASEGRDADREGQNAKASARKDDGEYTPSGGYVTKSAEMFIATPIDPLFLVLLALAPSTSVQEAKRLFLASDEYFDKMASKSAHLRTLLRTRSTQKRIEARMIAVCDTVDAGDETMYRLNEIKLLQELLQKAKRMVDSGLPSSMEEKFVTKALEVPMLSLKREESTILEGAEQGEAPNTSSAATPATDSMDSQNSTSSTDTLATSASFASTAATSISGADETAEQSNHAPAAATVTAPEGIPHLLRLRTALNFITTSYLPLHLQRTLSTLLQSHSASTVDFSPLNQHLSHLADLRQQALASRSLGDYSRKRTLDEDEETRAEKKRKKDEEEKKRKAGESRGVRELKKVNVKGMKKMSDFFTKS